MNKVSGIFFLRRRQCECRCSPLKSVALCKNDTKKESGRDVFLKPALDRHLKDAKKSLFENARRHF
jgi:hypothetical protein